MARSVLSPAVVPADLVLRLRVVARHQQLQRVLDQLAGQHLVHDVPKGQIRWGRESALSSRWPRWLWTR
jgi:hypothetical protein